MSGNTARDYFEQAAMWEGDHPAALTILDAVRSLVPDGTASLLDVGCGDGALTNRIRGIDLVVGGDISFAALQHVAGPRLNFSAGALPFPDGSFDVVIATDVIEHLPEPLLTDALAEMARVARVGVVFAVPFREPREYFRITCRACGTQYHAHGHLREYDLGMFAGVGGMSIARWVLAGPRWTYGDALAGPMRDLTGTNYEFPFAICPACGTAHDPADPGPDVHQAVRRFDALQRLRCERGTDPWPPPSELVVLMTHAPASADAPSSLPDEVGPAPASTTVVRFDEAHRRSDPENYAVDWQWLRDHDGVVLVLPTRPHRIEVEDAEGQPLQGGGDDQDGVTIALHDAVDARYLPIALVDGAADLPAVRPGPAGYAIRLDGIDPASDVVRVHHAAPPATVAEMAGLAFGSGELERSLERSRDEAVRSRSELTLQYESLWNDLQAVSERHQELVGRYEEVWNRLQEIAAEKEALNELANRLEAQRSELQQRLSSRS